MGQTCDAATASFYFTGLQQSWQPANPGAGGKGGQKGGLQRGVGERGMQYIYIYYKKKRRKKLRKEGIALVWWPSEK